MSFLIECDDMVGLMKMCTFLLAVLFCSYFALFGSH